MPRYEMKDLGYQEYVNFCNAEGIEPAPFEQYCNPEFLRKFLTDQQIGNAIWDKNGLTWAEHIKLFGSMESETPVTAV